MKLFRVAIVNTYQLSSNVQWTGIESISFVMPSLKLLWWYNELESLRLFFELFNLGLTLQLHPRLSALVFRGHHRRWSLALSFFYSFIYFYFFFTYTTNTSYNTYITYNAYVTTSITYNTVVVTYITITSTTNTTDTLPTQLIIQILLYILL